MRRVERIGGVLVLLVIGTFFIALGSLDRADKSASVLGVFISLIGLGIGIVSWRAARGGLDLDAAARSLAVEVRAQWAAEEARIGSLSRPVPLPVRWSSTGRPVQAPPEAVLGRNVTGARPVRLRLRGDVGRIVEAFRALPRRQLVVLGKPGSGKTVLAMQLLLDLLKGPQENEPVPVLLPLSSWNPEVPLLDWMTRRIRADHPTLTEDVISRLLTTERVMPILDGLDELAPHLHAKAIDAIDRAVTTGPLVLTCRGDEYETAVTSTGAFLSRAAVIELKPIKATEVIDFLDLTHIPEDDRWNPVRAHLRAHSDGPLAEALSTPLMADLARTVYERRPADPAELLDFTDRAAVEDHLLDAFIPAVYASGHPRRARRWLTYLAENMAAHGTRDLSWWQFRSQVVALTVAVLFCAMGWWFLRLLFAPPLAAPGALGMAGLGYFVVKDGVWAEIHRPDPRAIDPLGMLRRQRLTAIGSALLAGLGVGLVIAAVVTVVFAASSRSAGLYAAVFGSVFMAVSAVNTPWGTFLLSRLRLAATRRLPLRFTRFIADAHERGVLRQAGTVYQFRHARFQDRLAPLRPRPQQPEGALDRAEGFWGRQAGLVVAVALPAMVLFAVPQGYRLDYHSGAEPRHYTAADNPRCMGPESLNCGFAFVWELPPGAVVTTTLKVSKGLTEQPVVGFRGTIAAEGCQGAAVGLTLAGAGSASVTSSRFGEAPLKDLARGIASKPTRLTFTLRRLDSRPCTARLFWDGEGLSYDFAFKLKHRLRGDRPAAE
ncbi:NACHT domain-containing protein [Actinomadura sp. HBU206391]|uniref:NACHT domain-containing protein n=1 Tax=Actinomadura sp. HBU206391 TaxID=2731692 RepID=UPI0016509236|nr:NACHT domain-containing protein [Actinomadura sp. HBU206391]MBC6456589.1 NACHT domain-containing protein [Actinomadura sp. HBU206391]